MITSFSLRVDSYSSTCFESSLFNFFTLFTSSSDFFSCLSRASIYQCFINISLQGSSSYFFFAFFFLLYSKILQLCYTTFHCVGTILQLIHSVSVLSYSFLSKRQCKVFKLEVPHAYSFDPTIGFQAQQLSRLNQLFQPPNGSHTRFEPHPLQSFPCLCQREFRHCKLSSSELPTAGTMSECFV